MGRGLALRCLRGGVKSLERADARRKEGIAWLLGEPNSRLPSLQAKRFHSLLSGYANQFSTLRLAKPAKSSVLRVIKVKSFIFAIAAIWPSA